MKSLSVIVPIYNAEKYLYQCIGSIQKQTIENMEIILVDDGSTDRSRKICEEFAEKDSRIRIVGQSNCGKIEARYVGAMYASSDYITYVDADDWIAPDTYRSLWTYVEKDIDIISYRIIRYVNEDYQIQSRDSVSAGIYVGDAYYENVCKNMIWDATRNGFGVDPSLCNKLFKRELLLEALEQARQISIGYGDDVAVIYPMMLHANSYAVKDVFSYFHRQRECGKIPDYLLDGRFVNRLTDLYTYIRRQVGKNENYIKQLDCFYQYSINFRMNSINQAAEGRTYLFPFEAIPKDCKVILYGAGKIGKIYYSQLIESHYCKVAGWIDNSSKLGNDETSILKEQAIKTLEFDYVVIAIKDEGVAKQITDKLSTEYDVKPQQIIWKNHEYRLI